MQNIFMCADELLQKARQAELDDNAKLAYSLYKSIADKYEDAGDIEKARTYEIKAEVYNDYKPMRFINE